jgi:ketosteroid isomerase-like protein
LANYVSAQSSTKANENALASLKKFRSNYITAMRQENPVGIAGYYAESLRLMPEFQKTIVGRKNALLYFRAFAARYDIVSYNRNVIEVLDLGSRIVEIGLFEMKVMLEGTSKVYEIKGKYLDIWKKTSDDALQLITEAWNYSETLAIEEQLKFAEVPVVDIALQAHVPINDNVSFELAALNRLMEAAISELDDKIWAQFYADEGMYLYSRNPIYKGRQSIDDFIKKHVGEMPIFEKLDIRNDQIDDLKNNYVIEYASHIAIIRDGDFSGVFTGKDIRVWRREPNGSLKIFRSIAMYD